MPGQRIWISEKYRYTRISTIECTYWEIPPLCWVHIDSLSTLLLSPHFPQATLAYTPDVERLVVWFLCINRNERYGCELS